MNILSGSQEPCECMSLAYIDGKLKPNYPVPAIPFWNIGWRKVECDLHRLAIGGRVGTMDNFIINEPGHKRWVLPDGRHVANMVIHGDHMFCAVFNRLTNESYRSYTIDLRQDNWHDLMYGWQELCNKHYPKQLKARR